MKSTAVTVNITIPVQELDLDSLKNYYLTDLISGEIISGTLNQLATITTVMNKYTTKVFLLADSMAVVSAEELYTEEETIPDQFIIAQNYPNPFNPSTSIGYSIPEKGMVEIKVYDILGSEVAVLLNEDMDRGEHVISFNGSGLPSGAYIYRITYDGHAFSRKMMLLK